MRADSAALPRPGLPPTRFTRPTPLAFALYVAAGALVLWSLQTSDISLSRFIDGLPQMARLLGEMMPPATDRLDSVVKTLLDTFRMAIVGTLFGVILSLPLAICAARGLSPGRPVYYAARAMITFFRTVPDLIWAIFFVVTVGLGPFAGILALTVDTMGFCGRFFAEAMEEVDAGPQEALRAAGASGAGVIAGAVVPSAMPSMVASSLYALEQATRSSVVLGLVGAGGIGIELKAAIDMFEYDQAATIIIAIFLLVALVERVSSALRARII